MRLGEVAIALRHRVDERVELHFAAAAHALVERGRRCRQLLPAVLGHGQALPAQVDERVEQIEDDGANRHGDLSGLASVPGSHEKTLARAADTVSVHPSAEEME